MTVWITSSRYPMPVFTSLRMRLCISLFTEKMGIVAQGVQLAKDGCVDTILDWTQLDSAMRLNIKR